MVSELCEWEHDPGGGGGALSGGGNNGEEMMGRAETPCEINQRWMRFRVLRAEGGGAVRDSVPRRTMGRKTRS